MARFLEAGLNALFRLRAPADSPKKFTEIQIILNLKPAAAGMEPFYQYHGAVHNLSKRSSGSLICSISDIEAGQELQSVGRNITGFALRQKVGGGAVNNHE